MSLHALKEACALPPSVCCPSAVLTSPISSSSSLAKHGLLGSSVIPSKSFTPSVYLHVRYPSSQLSVNPGATLPVDKTQERPTLDFAAAEGDERFTVALLDPDAKSREEPIWAPFRHWLISGLKPGSPVKLDGEEHTGYMGPAPPAGTGPHRYAFLLPSAPRPNFFGDKDDRKKYNLAEFVDKNKLTLVGANFFLAENKK
ncbi:hypothetical protein JCM10207_000652 [Rhodosporidiobolus poonsookiae]